MTMIHLPIDLILFHYPPFLFTKLHDSFSRVSSAIRLSCPLLSRFSPIRLFTIRFFFSLQKNTVHKVWELSQPPQVLSFLNRFCFQKMKLLARPRYPNQPDYRNMDEDTPLVIFDETIFKDDFFLNNHLNIVFICSANIAQKEIWRTILKV